MKKIPVECWSRIVGYFRPLGDWHISKKGEFEDRVNFDIEKIKFNLSEQSGSFVF